MALNGTHEGGGGGGGWGNRPSPCFGVMKINNTILIANKKCLTGFHYENTALMKTTNKSEQYGSGFLAKITHSYSACCSCGRAVCD